MRSLSDGVLDVITFTPNTIQHDCSGHHLSTRYFGWEAANCCLLMNKSGAGELSKTLQASSHRESGGCFIIFVDL